MKKIISTLVLGLFPVISFAQNYGYRMMDGYGYNRGFETETGFWGIGLFLMFPIICLTLFIGMFIFWVMMLVDAIKHAPEKTKIVWVLVIIFTHVVGALIYYFVERRPKILKESKK